jgi:Ran GTPase-activating protein (RanGAP) involved in mRNA processing and transport
MPEVIEALSRADVVHQLRRLEMRRNKIGYVGASLLSKWMRPECSIEILNMWDNMLGDKGTRALALGLSSASRLRVLNLGSNSISDVGVDALAAAVGNHQCLRTLNLCSNAVSDLGAQALTAALVYNTSIQDVDLTHNASITSRAGIVLIRCMSALLALLRLSIPLKPCQIHAHSLTRANMLSTPPARNTRNSPGGLLLDIL